jgi:hypothetical protein
MPPTERGAQKPLSERLRARPSRTDGHERDERGRQPPSPLFSKIAPGPKQEDCEPGAGLIHPHPARSAQNSRMLTIRFIRIPPTFEGASPSQEKRAEVPSCSLAVKKVGARHAAPSERQQLEQSWQDRQGGSKRGLHRCGLHGRGSGGQPLGRSPAAISSAAPGGPHQPPQALLRLVQRQGRAKSPSPALWRPLARLLRGVGRPLSQPGAVGMEWRATDLIRGRAAPQDALARGLTTPAQELLSRIPLISCAATSGSSSARQHVPTCAMSET